MFPSRCTLTAAKPRWMRRRRDSTGGCECFSRPGWAAVSVRGRRVGQCVQWSSWRAGCTNCLSVPRIPAPAENRESGGVSIIKTPLSFPSSQPRPAEAKSRGSITEFLCLYGLQQPQLSEALATVPTEYCSYSAFWDTPCNNTVYLECRKSLAIWAHRNIPCLSPP